MLQHISRDERAQAFCTASEECKAWERGYSMYDSHPLYLDMCGKLPGTVILLAVLSAQLIYIKPFLSFLLLCVAKLTSSSPHSTIM